MAEIKPCPECGQRTAERPTRDPDGRWVCFDCAEAAWSGAE